MPAARTHADEAPASSEPPEDRRSAADPHVELVARVARGDERAFRELYDALSPRAFGLALRILRDRASAEEALVEVFAQVWRQAERFDARKASVATWVLTLARTRSIDLARIEKRRAQRETAVDDALFDGVDDAASGPLLASEHGERAQRVREALWSLPREQRVAVELAFFGGLSHTEVASALRAPLGTVKTRIRTGLSSLRVALAGLEGEL